MSIEWAKFIDAADNEDGGKIATDSSGNVYIIGVTNSSGFSISTVSGTVTKPNNTSDGTFVIKYNGSGVAQLAVFLDGSGYDANNGIAVDSVGNFYVSGGTTTPGFTISTASGNVTRTGANDGAYVVKYNVSGVAQWATFIDGSGGEFGNDISVDSSGNVYFIGYSSTPNFSIVTESGTVTRSNTSDPSSVFVKYNSSGIAQWAKFVDGASSEYGNAIAVDTFQNVSISVFTNTPGFSIVTASGTVTRSNTNDPAVLIVKYNSSGVAQWAHFIDGIGEEYGSSIAVDTLCNIYTSLSTNTPGFSIVTSSGTVTRSGDNFGGVVMKFTESGTIEWAQIIDGSGYDSATKVSLDAKKNIYITGNVNTSGFSFQTSSGTVSRPQGTGQYSGAYALKYNQYGTLQWAQFLDGTTDNEYGNGISACNTSLFVSGSTYSSGFQIQTASGTVTKPFGFTGGIFLVKYLFPTIPAPAISTTRYDFGLNTNRSEENTTGQRGDRSLSSGVFRGPVDFATLLRIKKGRQYCC
jgi:hypothetical protein